MSLESHNYYDLSGMWIPEGQWRALTSDPRNVFLRHSHVFNVCVVSRWTGVDARPLYPDLPPALPLIFDCGVAIRGRLVRFVRTSSPEMALHWHTRFLRRFTMWRVLVLMVSVAIGSLVLAHCLHAIGTPWWMVMPTQVFLGLEVGRGVGRGAWVPISEGDH